MFEATSPQTAEPAVAAQDCIPEFVPGQPAARVDRSLRQALAIADRARERAVLWFAEVARRSLFRELGHASLELYAVNGLGFSRNRYFQFKRLADELEKLPRLREAVAAGWIGWTKAQQVARVATPASEGQWVQKAATSSRRDFAEAVQKVRARSRARRSEWAGSAQLELPVVPEAAGARGGDLGSDPPITVSFRLDAVQFARLESLIERMRKRDVGQRRASREEMLLAAFESWAQTETAAATVAPGATAARTAAARAVAAAAVAPGATAAAAATPAAVTAAVPAVAEGPNENPSCAKGEPEPRGSAQPHGAPAPNENQTCTTPNLQPGSKARLAELRRRNSPPAARIVMRRCPDCEQTVVVTSRGDRQLSRAQAEAALCDARIVDERGHTHATIPPAVRAAVLARDGHRCQAPGCGSPLFLQVHHVLPRSEGGSNRAENLVTLCSRCHDFVHETAQVRHRGTAIHLRR